MLVGLQKFFGAGLLRVVEERLGGVLLHNDALLHEHHAVGRVAGKIVRPSPARLRMTASTSPVSSGSKADVGSSK